jgi:hypothetical protein
MLAPLHGDVRGDQTQQVRNQHAVEVKAATGSTLIVEAEQKRDKDPCQKQR